MENRIFGRQYAEAYDALYQDKDYEAECDIIEEVFRCYAEKPVESILDLGCGTANHVIPLSKRGYLVTGVDRSLEMVECAQNKIETSRTSLYKIPRFIQADIRALKIDQKFDAVITMFAVLGYQNTNRDLSDALKTIRTHMKAAGIFIFDFWYGPAVLAIGPEKRVKEIPIETGKLIRTASGILDTQNNLCEVNYRIQRMSGDQLEDDSAEKHVMRYFFPEELESTLSQHHMRLHSITAYPNFKKPADENTWNAIGVAKAV